jgi:anti-sigma-K factor RskA
MFSEVAIATERLALCLHTQRRIGAAHALLHLRRLTAACRRDGADDRHSDTAREVQAIVAGLERPLKDIDDALAADHLLPEAIAAAEARLSFVRFQLWQVERLRDEERSMRASA